MKQQVRNRIIQFLVMGLLICTFWVPNLWALEVPALRTRVNDHAGMLSAATRQQLEDILSRLEQTDSTQIVVLTIPSLGGEVLEEFSLKVAEKWQIGQKGFDNGAILLIAKNDRKLRIEVGYGLEGSLTDLMAGRIIRNVIVPQFKAGNFDQGIIDGVQAMIGVVRGEYQAPEKSPFARGSKKKDSSPGFGGLIAFVFFISMLGRLRRPMGIAAGGILAPIAASLFFNFRPVWILVSIPIGLLIGFILSFLGSPLIFGHGHHHHRHTGGG
ncbi:MAG: TPM domain-containing protein, partial [Desulfobacterales bacterium]|nr:TPM domain-containing protein [Desulfobacterales bacterium]